LAVTLSPIVFEFNRNFSSMQPGYFSSNSPLLWIVLGLSFWSICLTMGLLALMILAAALGVGLMLCYRNDLLSASITLMLIISIASFMLLGVWTNIATTEWYRVPMPFVGVLILSLIVAILPYIGAAAVARFSERWVRKPIV
jgi:hypothetical protein